MGVNCNLTVTGLVTQTHHFFMFTSRWGNTVGVRSEISRCRLMLCWVSGEIRRCDKLKTALGKNFYGEGNHICLNAYKETLDYTWLIQTLCLNLLFKFTKMAPNSNHSWSPETGLAKRSFNILIGCCSLR